MRRDPLSWWWPPLAARAARAYVAGRTVADAARACRELARRGFRGTIGYWNEDQDTPRRVADESIAAVAALAGPELRGCVSLKAGPMGFDAERLGEILDRARRAGVRVHFDSMGPEAADRTFALIASAGSGFPDLGCTIPGRWRRSVRDVDTAVELGLGVRVVKGQWADRDPHAPDPRSGFLDAIDRLAGRAPHVAVATHDPALAREAFVRLRAARTACELELLLGWPARAAIRQAVAGRIPVRIYVPYGAAHLPYPASDAARDPRMLPRLLTDLALGRPVLPRAASEVLSGCRD